MKSTIRAALAAIAILAATACDVPDRAQGPIRAGSPTLRETGRYGTGSMDRYQLYTPSNWKRSDRRTAIVFVHGGAWVAGTAADIEPLVSSLTRKGHVIVSLDYDLGVPVESQTRQLRRAVQWVVDNPGHLGIDPAKVFVAGHSAGGHLATMLAVTWGAGNPIRGVLAVAAPLDLTDPSYDPHIYGIRLHGAISASNRCPDVPCSPQNLARMSPISHVDAGDPPVYLVVGEHDPYAPPEHARRLERAFEQSHAENTRVWVDLVEGGDHQPGHWANSEYVEHFLRLYAG